MLSSVPVLRCSGAQVLRFQVLEAQVSGVRCQVPGLGNEKIGSFHARQLKNRCRSSRTGKPIRSLIFAVGKVPGDTESALVHSWKATRFNHAGSGARTVKMILLFCHSLRIAFQLHFDRSVT
jgi:hypothetical protein